MQSNSTDSSANSNGSLSNLSGQEQVIDLKKTFLTVYKVKWRILILSFLVTVLAAYVAVNMTPTYKATSTLLIESEQTNAINIEQVYGLNSGNQEYLLTQFEILKSRAIAKRVFDQLDIASTLEEPKPSFVQKIKGMIGFLPKESGELTDEQIEANYQAQISDFAKDISISPVRKTQLVKVSYTSTDPKLAALVSNAIGEAYIQSQSDAKSGITLKASDWVGGQLGKLKDTLEASENTLEAFRKEHDLLDISGIATLESDQIQRLKEEISAANTIKVKADSLLQVVEQYGNDDVTLFESLPVISGHPTYQESKKLLLEAQREFGEVSQVYGSKHPKYISAKSQLEIVEQNVSVQIQKIIEGIKKESQAANINLNVLQKEFDATKARYSKLTNLETKYRQLQREVDTNSQLYDGFLSRQREMDVALDFDSQVARFTDLAIIPRFPVKPNKKLIVMMAFVGSMGLCVMLALLLDALNNTIKSRDDIESVLALRSLGYIPRITKKFEENIFAKLFFNSEYKVFSEALRSIRTSISLLGIDKPLKVIEVTSSVPNEGKSSTSINLAYSFAAMEKVLLIDCDMRKPALAKRFELPAYQPGLSNLLAQTESIDECITKSVVENVDLLTAGAIPLNPLELLASKEFDALIEQLKTKYDRIIFDTPPVHAVSDALVLAPKCDASILVVKSDSTSTESVKRTAAQITQSHGKLLGVVLNQLNTKNAASYGYGYYQYEQDQES